MLGFLPEPMRKIVKGIGSVGLILIMIIYIISPVDLVPEIVLGPLGLIDDLFVGMAIVSILGVDFFKLSKKK